MEIGNVLRDWRLLERMRLADAAQRIGIPLSTLDRIEKGCSIEGRNMVILIQFLFGEAR
jgi:cytoskeletal protein RodZ